MRKIIVVAVALLGVYGVAMAQAPKAQQKSKSTQKKTVIVKKDGGNQTVVEIKNGDVFVNGEKIADAKDRTNGSYQKVIIDNNGPGEAPEPSMPRRFDDRRTMPRKAMLGVFTKNSEANGAEIADIAPNSGAAKAGLQQGDRITGVNDEQINNPEELIAAISKHDAGDKVKIRYERNGKIATAEATLGAPEQDRDVREYRHNYNGDEDFDLPGMGTPDMDMPGMDMPNGFKRHYEFNEKIRGNRGPRMGVTAEDRADGDGVKITNVKPSSPAEESGIKENDIITQFGDQKINSVADLQEAIVHLRPNEKTSMIIDRKGKIINLDFSIKRQVEKKDL